MRLLTIRQVHRWFAVTAGVFLLMWLSTAIVMVVPNPFSAPAPPRILLPLDLKKVEISPDEAVASLTQTPEGTPQVISLTLKRIADEAVYEITVEGGARQRIDARSGELFEITPQIAEQIVRKRFSTQARVLEIARIDQHDSSYSWGPLPVHRLAFDDDSTTLYNVNMGGDIRWNTRLDRILGAMESVHTFHVLKRLIRRDKIRRGLVVLCALVGIGAATSGYYIALTRVRGRRA
jgi:hypothetical protein